MAPGQPANVTYLPGWDGRHEAPARAQQSQLSALPSVSVLALAVPTRWSVTNCVSQLAGYKTWSFCFLFISSPPPLLNFDTFQFSIWLSTIPRRKIHTVRKHEQNVVFIPLSGSSTRLTKLHTTAHRTHQDSQSYLTPAVKKQEPHCTREGSKARDLILKQFAALVLHPAVNYVPFNATIAANGYRADKNTKWAQPSTYRGDVK